MELASSEIDEKPNRFVQLRLDRFKKDLAQLEGHDAVRKHIILGDCYVLNADLHYTLRASVSNEFSIRPENVLMVGSGKLGFSIAPDKRYRPFSDTSDIDLALVSDKLFDEIWMDVLRFDVEVGSWDEKRMFRNYLMNGWIRPDSLPRSQLFPRRDHWWNFFRSLSECGSYGSYKIAAGIYRTPEFLERYQLNSVMACKAAVELGS